MTASRHFTDSGGNAATDWATWVLCDVHRDDHPLNPPDSPCVNPHPAPPHQPKTVAS